MGPAAGHLGSPAVHDHAVLAFFVEGHAISDQKESFEVRAGDALLVPAGEAHRLRSCTATKVWGVGFFAASFAPSELAPLLDPFERTRAGASAVVRIPASRQERLANRCAELLEETERDVGPYSELAQKSLLALVLAEVARAASFTPTTSLPPTLVAEALRFIERRCLEPISLRDVARAVGRSPAHVTTSLKKATGRSAGEWIVSGRLAEARNRLVHTDERIEIIAERVGYADPTHFIRLFRRAHGATPASWRAKRRRPTTGAAARATRATETSADSPGIDALPRNR